jgi:hypothetical protein
MAEELESTENSGGGPAPESFWVTARAWWDVATRDSGSVKRNLAMLGGVTVAVILCIWSLGGAIALIVGSVHVWSLAGTGVGAASVLSVAGIQWRRKRPKG